MKKQANLAASFMYFGPTCCLHAVHVIGKFICYSAAWTTLELQVISHAVISHNFIDSCELNFPYTSGESSR